MTTLSYSEGLPTPGSTLNSVADPEIVSALNQILAWADGEIDTVNLSATANVARSQLATGAGYMNWIATSSTSPTASDGQLLNCTSSSLTTVTLPGPSLGRLVGVRMGGFGSPVVVNATGSSIFGEGIPPGGVSSIQVGTPGAVVIFMSSATAWGIISGKQDSGWVPLAPAAGIASGGYGAAARLRGDTVQLKGTLVNNTGGTYSGTLTTAGTQWRPTQPLNLPVALTPLVTTSVMAITTGGAFSIPGGLGNSGAVNLDGVTYSLS